MKTLTCILGFLALLSGCKDNNRPTEVAPATKTEGRAFSVGDCIAIKDDVAQVSHKDSWLNEKIYYMDHVLAVGKESYRTEFKTCNGSGSGGWIQNYVIFDNEDFYTKVDCSSCKNKE